MELTKINGSTYYINAPTNIGVYVFKDKYTLLIDTGNNNQQARKISEIITNNNYIIKYLFNTHNHIDHSGGNVFFKEHFPGSVLHCSEQEKLFAENSHLFPMYLYGGSPVKELAKHFVKAKKYSVDVVVEPGMEKINNEKFEFILLPGHSDGQMGIATKDRVCFLGDALFSEEIIKKYSFPFLFNINDQLKTYQLITNLDYDYFVLSHSGKIYLRDEINQLVNLNNENLNKYLNMAWELLTQPKTKEELFEEIAILADLELTFKEYYFSLSSTGAIVSYFYDQDLLDYQIENGKLYYYRK